MEGVLLIRGLDLPQAVEKKKLAPEAFGKLQLGLEHTVIECPLPPLNPVVIHGLGRLGCTVLPETNTVEELLSLVSRLFPRSLVEWAQHIALRSLDEEPSTAEWGCSFLKASLAPYRSPPAPHLKETTGGEFRVYGASIRLL